VRRWVRSWKPERRCGHIVAKAKKGEIILVRCGRRAPWRYTFAGGVTMSRCDECKAFIDLVEEEIKRAVAPALAKGKG
jgi:hypothetical protein